MNELVDPNFWNLVGYHSQVLKLLAVGLLGSSVRVALGMAAGEPLSPAVIFSTVTTGTFLCTTVSVALTQEFKIDPVWTIPIGFVIAIQGMKIVKIIMELDWKALIEPLVQAVFARLTSLLSPRGPKQGDKS